MTCEKCQILYCFVHANAHPKETCESYIRRTCREEKSNQKYIKRMSKECPNCKAPTEKSGGCNHMTCQHCGFGWCWICSRPYTYDHYDLNNVDGSCILIHTYIHTYILIYTHTCSYISIQTHAYPHTHTHIYA